MTDRPTLEDLDAAPDDGPWCCTGNAEDCALCTDPNPNYPWICPGHPRTVANERIVGEAAQAQKAAASLYTVDGTAVDTITLPPKWIVIDGDRSPLVKIHLEEGTLEFGPEYTPDEAGRRFWDAVRDLLPSQMVRTLGRLPAETINQHLAAARTAEKRVRELEAEVAAARDLHTPIRHMGQAWCAECSVRRRTGPRTQEWVAFVPHPCATVRALGGAE
ncbi:hypothetical protein ABZ784_28975 [Streptomyces tendae]|uniref:hypothetical protein n=1 Tax=Streptomyces tendae TaxID=1932 RepID=UPI0033D320AB